VPPRHEPPQTSLAARRGEDFSDGVTAPAVLDRGADHARIARSLAEYGRWLEWHDPDPALVERAYAPNSALARNMVKGVNEMRRRHQRVEEVDSVPLDFAVVSELPNVVSFRVTEHLARRDVVATSGRALRHSGAATEHYVVLMMRFSSDAPWRLLVVERQGAPIEVEL